MTQEHPITPPTELIRKWNVDAVDAPIADKRYIATQAARWGADQELEACREWLKEQHWEALAIHLRAARRPKPLSLKEQALALIQSVEASDDSAASWDFSVIRRALESLPD